MPNEITIQDIFTITYLASICGTATLVDANGEIVFSHGKHLIAITYQPGKPMLISSGSNSDIRYRVIGYCTDNNIPWKDEEWPL